MTTQHQTDASGTRDLTKEATDIKIKLTSKPETTTTTEVKKASISFTTLAQSAIPNFAAAKILGNRIIVRYVPDFYYIMLRSQILFALAKNDKALKRIDSLNMYSFTLYMAYALMYVYLETINEINASNSDVTDVLSILRSVGFNHSRFPAFISYWLDGLGKYVSPETGRTFLPYLPTVANAGDYFDNYFLSADTGHLLPNFRAAFSMIALFSDPPSVNIPPNNRTANCKIGSDFTAVAELVGTYHGRRNARRIPGLERLMIKITDTELPILISNALNVTTWPSDLHRYMMLDKEVLRHVKESTSDLFLHIDTCLYSNPSPIGNSMCALPLITDVTRSEFQGRIQSNAVPSTGNVPTIPAVDIASGYDHASRVKSRFEIVNGNVDYVYQTPIVRIIVDDESVKIGNHVHVSPQDTWYTIEHEFTTPVVTLYESLAYFNKN